jgi:acetyl-CoA synthetase
MEAFKAARDFLLAHRTDAAAAAAFRWPVAGPFNWALDWFDGELARGPHADQAALRIVGEHAATLSFAELSERSSRIAGGLRDLGMRRGDRLLLMLGNVVALWEAMLAAMKLGAVISPASTLLTPGDLADRIARGRIGWVIAAPELTGRFAAVAAGVVRIATGAPPPGWLGLDTLRDGAADFAPDGPTGPDDPMLLYFTSGTTALPKLVLHSQRSYPVGSLSTMYWLGLQPGDVHLNVSSPGWAKHAWSSLFAPWNAGATVFVVNQPRFHAPSLLDAIRDGGVTTLCAPPTVWRMLIQQPLAQWRTALREVCAAGEPLNPEVIAQVQAAWGLVIRDGYGQTETTAQIGNPPGAAVTPGAMGRPLPGYRILLLDPQGQPADEGEVAVALDPPPAGLMRGYMGADGGVTGIAGDAYRTGDVARRAPDGTLTYVGRADDIFKAADYRISPFELESVLIEHPLVGEAAVVPSPDALRLAVPKAFIALAGDAEGSAEVARAIFIHIRARLAPYKRIRRIAFCELPKTISGKIRRVELRRLEQARGGAARPEGEYREEDFAELG